MVTSSRRNFVSSLCRAAVLFSFDELIKGLTLGVQFVNVPREAGLHAKTIFGGASRNRLLLETTGCGVAFFDYGNDYDYDNDNDGWLDIFFAGGTRFQFRNRRTGNLYDGETPAVG